MKTINLIEARKNQILDAAIIVFSKEGFANANTDKIARLANLGKGTIYRYFKNKKALFLSVVDRGLNKLKESMFTEVNKTDDPLEKIETAIRTYLSFFEKNPYLVDILIHEHSGFSERIKKKYFEHYYGNKDKIIKNFKTGIQKGLIKNIDIEAAISILTSILHGFVYKWHIENKRYRLLDKAPTICKIFFTGVAKDKNRRKEYE